MKNEKQWRFLCLFGDENVGEEQEQTANTLQTEQSGEVQESTPVAGENEDPEAKKRAFRALMEGEYKELFTAYFQETFNRRFREQKEMGDELEKSRMLVRAAADHFGVPQEELLAAIRAEDGKKNAPTASAASESEAPKRQITEQELDDAVAAARLETEQQLLAAIRARGLRPAEAALHTFGGNALSGESGRMSRARRAELARRAAEGEHILL